MPWCFDRLLIRLCVVSPQLAAQLCQSAQSLQTQSIGPAGRKLEDRMNQKMSRVTGSCKEVRKQGSVSKHSVCEGSSQFYQLLFQDAANGRYCLVWNHQSTSPAMQSLSLARHKHHPGCRSVSLWDSDRQRHQKPSPSQSLSIQARYRRQKNELSSIPLRHSLAVALHVWGWPAAKAPELWWWCAS